MLSIPSREVIAVQRTLLHAILAVGLLFASRAVPSAFAQNPATLTRPAPAKSLGIASVANLRDIGGYQTQDGRLIKSGLVFRSNQLARISAADQEKIAALGLKNDYDLRRPDERDSAPDALPANVNNIWLNVVADSKGPKLPQFAWLIQNPREANEAWGDGKMETRFVNAYRDFVSLPSAQQCYRRLFSDLADEKNLPALYHCTSGKDRTGWATAALLSLLGVPRDQVYADYLLSNDIMLPGYKRSIDGFERSGGQPAILNSMLGVKPEFLDAAFDEVSTKYGTIENYFSQALQIDAAGQQALKERLLIRKD